MDESEVDREPAERRAMAALRWDERYGDRHTSLVALVHRADASEIQDALRDACLNEVEFAAGQEFWATLDDPFGGFHTDPCDDLDLSDTETVDAVSITDNTDQREA
jgi:hypothetical protein